MTINVAPSTSALALGKQGENLARAFAFDISKWVEEFGDGTAVLLHQRKGDAAPYPCTITQGDGVATWAVTSADNAVAGKGKAELQYVVDDVVVKSHTFTTVTLAGLEEAGEAPDPETGWVAELLESVKATVKETIAENLTDGDGVSY
ncbi:MAG: hypothetical protein LUE89_01190 [Clostridiales bacterium]|nr:hypothetical protein [Clostridiales bacterium]